MKNKEKTMKIENELEKLAAITNYSSILSNNTLLEGILSEKEDRLGRELKEDKVYDTLAEESVKMAKSLSKYF